MAKITLPGGLTPDGVSGRMTLQRADVFLENMVGATQRTSFGKAVWLAEIKLEPMKDSTFGAWRAALAQLSSYENTFDLQPFEYGGPGTGYSGADPLVAGAGQTGTSLNVDGLPISTAILKAGDYISVLAGGVEELKIVTADVTSSLTGTATINFEPALRNSPNDNATVRLQSPRCEFALVNPQAVWLSDLRLVGRGLTLHAREVHIPT